ncbi:MAG: hypothetical protein V4509_05125 [Patescibacteria group bacterium]
MNEVTGATTEQLEVMLGAVSKEVNKVNKEVEKVNYILVGVVLVLFIGFVTLLFSLAAIIVDAWKNRPSNYDELNSTISNMKIKLDSYQKSEDRLNFLYTKYPGLKKE